MAERLRRWATPVVRLLSTQGGLPLVWIILTAVVLVPVWHQRLLPMLDTPNHLALVRGWHSFHDPRYHISDYFELRLRLVPYIFFYAFVDVAMYVVPIEVANKLFLSLYLILFPLAILALARALKRSPWLAIGGFALAFNQNWIYGFSSYLMGTVFMFFSLALLIGCLRDGGTWRAVLLGICSVLAYFSHVLPWVILGSCAVPLLILNWRRWRNVITASLAMLPSLVLGISAYYEDKAERVYMKTGSTFSAVWKDFPTSVMDFPRRVMDLFPGRLDYLVLAIIALTVVGLVAWKGSQRGERDLESRQLKWILVIMGIAYLALPYSIAKPMSWWYVSPRIPSMMMPVLLLLPMAPIADARRLILVPMIAACLFLPLKLARLYRDFSNRNMGFMQLVNEVPVGKNVFVAVRGMMRGSNSEEASGDPATSAPVYWHFSSWPMALHGGYGPHVFDQGVPIRPVVKLKAPTLFQADTFDIRQAPEFDYYLVRQPTEAMDREPALRLVDRLGEWVLFQRVGPTTDEP